MLRTLNSISKKSLAWIQSVISHPVWFWGTLIITLLWMAGQHFMPHPLDPPKDFYPLTVLVYSLLALWIENAMKAQQAEQSREQQAQADRMEELLDQITIMLHENKQRDDILHNLITVVDMTVDKTLEAAEKLLALEGGATKSNGP